VRIACVTLACAVACISSSLRAADAIPADHPVLGSWSIAKKDGTCSETYRFGADGTAEVTSGEETARIAYEISATPSAKRFYRWKHRVVQDNGKKDCFGKTTKPGDESTWYIQFDVSRQSMIICSAESTASCFGPLKRGRP